MERPERGADVKAGRVAIVGAGTTVATALLAVILSITGGQMTGREAFALVMFGTTCVLAQFMALAAWGRGQ